MGFYNKNFPEMSSVAEIRSWLKQYQKQDLFQNELLKPVWLEKIEEKLLHPLLNHKNFH